MTCTVELRCASCGSVFTAMLPKPASASMRRAVRSPHIAPSPAPPAASETLMQWRQETV